MHRTAGWLGALLLVACAKENEYVAPPPPPVTVAPPEVQDITDYAEFTGTTAPFRIVEVRARVKGFLQQMAYQAGTVVDEGTVLFRIDPAEYEAVVQSAEANLASARADLTAADTAIRAAQARVALADTAVAKLERAFETNAVSEIMVLETRAKRDVARAELDHAQALKDVAQAGVGVAQASLTHAQLDLSYTTVKAPMRGFAERRHVEVGDLVGAGDATLLTRIVDTDKVYAWFNVSESWALQVGRARRAEGARSVDGIPIELALTGEEGFPHAGVLDYRDPTVDPQTGTLRVRAILDNADGTVPGGAFVRIRVPIARIPGALLVPERALSSDQLGDFLLVVGPDGTVARRNVKLGAQQGPLVHVTEGLAEGDRIIVDGLQRARPGAKVRPETAQNP